MSTTPAGLSEAEGSVLNLVSLTEEGDGTRVAASRFLSADVSAIVIDVFEELAARRIGAKGPNLERPLGEHLRSAITRAALELDTVDSETNVGLDGQVAATERIRNLASALLDLDSIPDRIEDDLEADEELAELEHVAAAGREVIAALGASGLNAEHFAGGSRLEGLHGPLERLNTALTEAGR